MACSGCAARRARAAKWFAIAADRARSLINPSREVEPDARSEDAQDAGAGVVPTADQNGGSQ